MPSEPRRTPARRRALRRSRAIAACSVLALIGGVAVVLGLGHRAHAGAVTATASVVDTVGEAAPTTSTTTAKEVKAKIVVHLGKIPRAVPGRARVVTAGPAAHRRVALTFDDGYCARCVRDLVRAVERTGAHVTFCPNGAYAQSWESQRRAIRRMLATGQVAMCNHTFSHADLRHVDAARLQQEIDRNEQWIERTFGVTARPYLRPPYGSYDAAVLGASGNAGFTRVVMWSGTLADSSERTEDYLVDAVRYWAKPGAIILAHGNYPETPRAFDRILAVLRHRHLHTATLPELLGT